MADFAELRQRMIKEQLIARGIRDTAVLRAMIEVPREEFVSADQRQFAYRDSALPIGQAQTISQPYIVALMTEALELKLVDRVLEVGTGSGYGAAIASRIAGEVYSVERHSALAHVARERFDRLGYRNIHVSLGNGTLGWPEHAPYNAIVVTAGGPSIPDPLREQLAVGGRMVIPVGPVVTEQELIRVRRLAHDSYRQEDLGGVRFVPLIGKGGWPES
jgi:protein-L-isoaspartate(D-aspartate) O-methyltransferase